MFAAQPPAGIPDDDDSLGHAGALHQALLAAAGYAQYEVSRLRAARAGSARTTSTTGASATTWASAPARTASSRSAREQDDPASLEGQASARLSRRAPARPAAIGGDERDRAGAAPVRLHAQCAAAGRRLRAGRFRGAHRPATRSAIAARTRACRARAAGWTIDGDRVVPTELGPALHQRRDRAVPDGLSARTPAPFAPGDGKPVQFRRCPRNGRPVQFNTPLGPAWEGGRGCATAAGKPGDRPRPSGRPRSWWIRHGHRPHAVGRRGRCSDGPLRYLSPLPCSA